MSFVDSDDMDGESDLLPMREVERRYITRVLAVTQGNRTEAARILGFDRKTLYRKLIRYGIRSSGEPNPVGERP